MFFDDSSHLALSIGVALMMVNLDTVETLYFEKKTPAFLLCLVSRSCSKPPLPSRSSRRRSPCARSLSLSSRNRVARTPSRSHAERCSAFQTVVCLMFRFSCVNFLFIEAIDQVRRSHAETFIDTGSLISGKERRQTTCQ